MQDMSLPHLDPRKGHPVFLVVPVLSREGTWLTPLPTRPQAGAARSLLLAGRFLVTPGLTGHDGRLFLSSLLKLNPTKQPFKSVGHPDTAILRKPHSLTEK